MIWPEPAGRRPQHPAHASAEAPDSAPQFDPYYEWLGIAPHERPCSYYRLLGLAELETNPAVIQNAADRQMAHVRNFSLGPRSKASQEVARVIAQAAGTLLDQEKKREYDTWLRPPATVYVPVDASTASESDDFNGWPRSAAAAPAATATAPEMIRSTAPAMGGRRTYRRAPRPDQDAGHFLKWMVGGIAGIALGLLIVAWLWGVSPQEVIKRLQEPPAKNQGE